MGETRPTSSREHATLEKRPHPTSFMWVIARTSTLLEPLVLACARCGSTAKAPIPLNSWTLALLDSRRLQS